MATEEPEWKHLPLQQRWTHTQWNARQDAYRQAAQEFSLSDEALAPFTDGTLLRAAATDANVNALDAGVRAVAAFVAVAHLGDCARVQEQVLRPMAEKGLAAVKPAVKSATSEAIVAFVAAAQDPTSAVEEIVPLTAHKMPKVSAAATATLANIYQSFGAKAVSPKPALAVLPSIFGQTDKNVRAEASRLAVALVHDLGRDTLSTVLQGIKPVQLKELQDQFDAALAQGPPERKQLRSADASMAAEPAENLAADISMADDEIDSYDLIPATAVLHKLPTNLDERLSSAKWKERKEALDAVLALVQVPKLEEGEYSHLVRLLQVVVQKDANVMCAHVAIQAIGSLATALRRGFACYATCELEQALVDRFKEKKAAVLESISQTLHAIVLATNALDVFSVLVSGFASKVPQIKLETSKFVAAELAGAKEVPPLAGLKSIVDAAVKQLGDTLEPVRQQGAILLGTIMKIYGERSIGLALANLDDIRIAKVKEASEKAEVLAKAPTKPAAATGAPAGRPAGSNRPGVQPRLQSTVPRPGSTTMRPLAQPRPESSAHSSMPPPGAAGNLPGRTRRPLSATPVKKTGARTVQTAEFTPIRQPPTMRRRMVSPLKSQERPAVAPSLATTSEEDVTGYQREIQRLAADLESVRLRLEAEVARSEMLEASNSRLREELAQMRKPELPDTDLNKRLSTMNLGPTGQGHKISALRPLRHSRQDNVEKKPASVAIPSNGLTDWRQTSQTTADLKRRIEAIKRNREGTV